MDETDTAVREITITRVFEASREEVWRAWTDPEQLKRWFRPHGFTVPECTVDLRPGGVLRMVILAPDGSQSTKRGRPARGPRGRPIPAPAPRVKYQGNLLSFPPKGTGRRQVSARDAGGVLASKAGCGPEALARYFRVLGDPTRLRIIEALLERERTVSELVSLVGAPQSRVSNHLACLKWCRFADAERRGRRVVYRIADPEVEQLMRVARSLASAHSEHLATCRRIGPDWI